MPLALLDHATPFLLALARGESMRDAGIFDGNVVLVETVEIWGVVVAAVKQFKT